MPSKKKAVGTPKKDDDASPLRHRIEKAVGTPKKDDDASPTTKYSSFENEKAVDTLKQNYHGDIEGGEVRMLGGRTAKKFTSASFVKMPSTVDDSTTEDQYIIHAVKILEQVKYRINMYTMAKEWCMAKDRARFDLPIQVATTSTAVLSFLTLLSSPSMKLERAYVSLLIGFLGVFATTMAAFRSAQKLNVKGHSFGQAETQYKKLFSELCKSVAKRKAQYVGGKPPKCPKGQEVQQFEEFKQQFDSKYRYIMETQQKMKYFPPRKMILKWTAEGKLTGAAPRLSRRRKLPDGPDGKPCFGGWEQAPAGDLGVDDAEWEYEKAETGDDDFDFESTMMSPADLAKVGQAASFFKAGGAKGPGGGGFGFGFGGLGSPPKGGYEMVPGGGDGGGGDGDGGGGGGDGKKEGKSGGGRRWGSIRGSVGGGVKPPAMSGGMNIGGCGGCGGGGGNGFGGIGGCGGGNNGGVGGMNGVGGSGCGGGGMGGGAFGGGGGGGGGGSGGGGGGGGNDLESGGGGGQGGTMVAGNAQMRGAMGSKMDGMNGQMDGKMGAMNGKMDGMNGQMVGKMGAMNGKMDGMNGQMNGKMGAMEGKLDGQKAAMEGQMDAKMSAMGFTGGAPENQEEAKKMAEERGKNLLMEKYKEWGVEAKMQEWGVEQKRAKFWQCFLKYKQKLEAKKAELEFVANGKREEIEAKRMALETELQEKKAGFEAKATAELEKKEREAKLKGAPFNKEAELQKLKLEQDAYEKEHRLKERGLNAALDAVDNAELVMNPVDDPLLVHAEYLDGDTSDEDEAEGKLGKGGFQLFGGDKVKTDQGFREHMKSLLQKVYWRQNMYLHSAQHLDACERGLTVPITVLTGVTTLAGFAGSSPMFENYPQVVSTFTLFFGVACSMLGARLSSTSYSAKAEAFRAAAGQYRLIATSLEEKLRAYLSYPSGSDVRLDLQLAWKQFFSEVSDRIKLTMIETNMLPDEKQVTSWIEDGTLKPNVIDQPELPTAPLEVDEIKKATLISFLDRAAKKKEKYDAALGNKAD